MHSSGLSTTYTLLHVATMLFADPDCCTRTYVCILPPSYTSQRVNYTAVLKYVKSHWYPKSTRDIRSLWSLQAALWVLKRLENCPFLHRARSEDGIMGGAEIGKEREGQEELDETIKGKEAPADSGKKLPWDKLIVRKEGMKGFAERLALWFGVVNSRGWQKAISPLVKSYNYCSCTE